MKKLIWFILSFAFVLGLVACSDSTISEDKFFTVTFDVQGGTDVQSIEVKEGSSITLTNYSTTKSGFDFDGWALSINGQLLTGSYKVTANVTLYAKFTQQVESYQISFYDEEGTLLTTKTVAEGVTPSYNYNPSDTDEWDYTFEGWKESQLSSTVLTSLPAATDNASYYAAVTATKKQYTLTFITNGGSTINTITVDYGTEVSAPTNPIKEGFNFVSWTTDAALNNAATWPFTVQSNVTFYAAWNEKIKLGTYLQALLNSYQYDIMDFIPTKMQPGEVLVNASQTTLDFTNFVNLSDIPNGYGEQWQMVLDNLEQTKSFTQILSVVDSLSISAVTVFNNYIDSNPSDVNNFTFTSGIYNITIKYEDDVIFLVIDFTANIPGFGNQTAQIMLNYNISNQEKEGRIQIGDANALRYVITEDSYTFAIRYLGIRRAYFNIKENHDGSVEGAIFEFLGIDNGISTSSAAQFYITDDYVSVVGNKASGIIGFTSTINELYNPSTGKLLGYEIRETVSSITYNTLWFNLSDQTGITSIKKIDQANGSNPNSIYVNGSATLFASKTVGGLSLKSFSRRYDIEFRKQYVYYLDGAELTRAEIEVPMLFVQAEQYASLVTDVKSNNANLSTFNMTVSTSTKSKIEADYSTMIDIFITNKESIKVEDIIGFIGNKYTH
ncbi:InlB B-repeat-containing protein [Acholeplasma equirhinis]|uniref:InlB B-repeat-containing protein n=1 Tax=Acholeplasma equirhinis TaxID=555393 RepID=UPI00197AB031|nr:InlB B-repeat-containing protein [Acholeplasma equirhinis]MBN3491130.1 InlB B-repeat-containing protein [Acholeplasma equirhinis]